MSRPAGYRHRQNPARWFGTDTNQTIHVSELGTVSIASIGLHKRGKAVHHAFSRDRRRELAGYLEDVRNHLREKEHETHDVELKAYILPHTQGVGYGLCDAERTDSMSKRQEGCEREAERICW